MMPPRKTSCFATHQLSYINRIILPHASARQNELCMVLLSPCINLRQLGARPSTLDLDPHRSSCWASSFAVSTSSSQVNSTVGLARSQLCLHAKSKTFGSFLIPNLKHVPASFQVSNISSLKPKVQSFLLQMNLLSTGAESKIST